MNNSIEEIISKLNEAENVAIFCHVRPDGDALGSGLALCLALRNAGKKAVMCCDDVVPEKFLFLDAMRGVSKVLPNSNYDTLISVDCADVLRMGAFSKVYKNFPKTTINIDHHVSNDGYGKYNYVQICPASCEIVLAIINRTGYQITKDIADLLMVGLLTDTGNFTHQDVNAETFVAAAHLRLHGADVNLINYNLFERQPKERAILYGRVMSDIKFLLDGKLAYIVIPKKDMDELKADKSLTEGFVDFPLTVDGVEVAMSLLEYKKGQYKVSLRSKGKVNVSAVAMSFGGGGHVLASGCMLFGELEEVVERLSYAVYQNL